MGVCAIPECSVETVLLVSPTGQYGSPGRPGRIPKAIVLCSRERQEKPVVRWVFALFDPAVERGGLIGPHLASPAPTGTSGFQLKRKDLTPIGIDRPLKAHF
jgi:hypothetical protein